MQETPHTAPPARFYEKHGAFCLALAAAVLMGLVLFAGDGVGLSNNGDYGRVMSTNSLTYADSTGSFVYEDTFRMVFEGPSAVGKLCRLLFSLENTGAYPSIHLVFVRASLAGNLALNLLTGRPLDTYHIQVLGLIYLLCYAGLLFLLFRSFRLQRPWMDLLVKLLMVAVLCDEGYIAYFNSLYSESVQMLGLLAMAVFALRCLTGRGRLVVNAPLFFLSCVVYGWSKFINIPVAVLCILGLGTVLLLRSGGRRRRWLVVSGVLCIAVLGAVYLSLPGWMDYETNYNSVFYGVLKDASPEQREEYLADLGLPAYMAEYADSNYYMDRAASARESAEFRADFSQISKFDLLFFYLRHPGRFLQKLDVAMAHSGFIRPYYLSNLDAGHPRLTFANRFGGWSYVRGQLPFNTWAFSGLVTLAGCLCLWRLLKGGRGDKKRGLQAAVLVLTLLGSMAYQFLMPIVTNGEGDLAKHMFAFAQFIDLLLLLLLARLGAALCRMKRLKYPTPVLAGGLAAVLCLGLLVPAVLGAAGTGETVVLGSWEGTPITWQVVSRGDGRAALLADRPVALLPFSEGGGDGLGSNLWSDSSLRAWLNGEFLEEAFTTDERALLLSVEHRVLLSGANKALADSGYNDFFAFHVPAYSDRGTDAALAETVSDAVRLPDIGLMADLSRSGRLGGAPCWMETPYYNNASMLRILGSDGYFYMHDAADAWGVRPVIVVEEAALAAS